MRTQTHLDPTLTTFLDHLAQACGLYGLTVEFEPSEDETTDHAIAFRKGRALLPCHVQLTSDQLVPHAMVLAEEQNEAGDLVAIEALTGLLPLTKQTVVTVATVVSLVTRTSRL